MFSQRRELSGFSYSRILVHAGGLASQLHLRCWNTPITKALQPRPTEAVCWLILILRKLSLNSIWIRLQTLSHNAGASWESSEALYSFPALLFGIKTSTLFVPQPGYQYVLYCTKFARSSSFHWLLIFIAGASCGPYSEFWWAKYFIAYAGTKTYMFDGLKTDVYQRYISWLFNTVSTSRRI